MMLVIHAVLLAEIFLHYRLLWLAAKWERDNLKHMSCLIVEQSEVEIFTNNHINGG